MYIYYCPDVYYIGPPLNQHWLDDFSRWRSRSAQTAITIRQTAVTVYFRRSQLLPFAFTRQRIGAYN